MKLTISKYINIPVFFISLAVGILVMYVFMPDNRKIYVYPSPENVAILQYRDKSGKCFQYEEKQVACPTNKTLIRNIPMQN
jgi:hypothetical protein